MTDTDLAAGIEAVIQRRDAIVEAASDATPKQMAALFDDLIQYSMDKFGEFPASREEVKQVLNELISTKTLDRNTLAAMSPGVIPVAVLKDILGIRRIYIDLKLVTKWKLALNKLSPLLPNL